MSSDKSIYLYDMSSAHRHQLCEILDKLNIWEDLAIQQMGYDRSVLEELKRVAQNGNSPSDELITQWGNLNHTATELFVLLYRMRQFNAMNAIRDLVDVRYHRLIPAGGQDLSEKGNVILSDENNETKPLKTSGSHDKKKVKEYASTIPQINYSDLIVATRNWNVKNILGKGGFGTVFRGIWKCTAVAIKRIEYKGCDNSIETLNELRFLNSCRHDNILPLYGYSVSGEESCLVYQLMEGGSLEQRLFGNTHYSALTWQQRYTIMQGTARGLQYLHTFKEKPLIHGDIKPANILLDPCFQPKICDFGLAREGPNYLDSHIEVSRVYGTIPYLPVEFLSYRNLSTKVDTYSFGVVLFEVVTGLRAYTRPNKWLVKHIQMIYGENMIIDEIMDKATPMNGDSRQMSQMMIELGLICVAHKPEQRPEMVTVLSRFDAFKF